MKKVLLAIALGLFIVGCEFDPTGGIDTTGKKVMILKGITQTTLEKITIKYSDHTLYDLPIGANCEAFGFTTAQEDLNVDVLIGDIENYTNADGYVCQELNSYETAFSDEKPMRKLLVYSASLQDLFN